MEENEEFSEPYNHETLLKTVAELLAQDDVVAVKICGIHEATGLPILWAINEVDSRL